MLKQEKFEGGLVNANKHTMDSLTEILTDFHSTQNSYGVDPGC